MERTSKMGRPPRGHSVALQILEGASQVFGAKGLADTRVEDILQAASVSRRTFYRFFRNKEAVFEALFAFGTAQIEQRVRDTLAAGGTLEEKLVRAVRAGLETMASWGDVGRAMIAEALLPGSGYTRFREQAVASLRDMLEDELAQRYGQPVDPLLLSALFAAMEYVAVSLAQSESQPFDLERGEAVMMRIITATVSSDAHNITDLPLVTA